MSKKAWGDWWPIFVRDKCTCVYCGFEGNTPLALRQFEIDHLIPKAVGGLDVPANKVLACRYCNETKSSFDPGDGDAKKPRSLDHRRTLIERAKRYINSRTDNSYGGPGEESRDFEQMMAEVQTSIGISA